MSLELPATTHLQGLKCQSKLLHAVEQSSLELLDCELKFIHISFWLALKGRAKFAMSTMHAVVLCRSSPPLKETKTQTISFPEATFTYCYGSHIRIEREAILGSLPQAGSSQWNQPFSAQYCLTTTETNADFVAWIFWPCSQQQTIVLWG